MGLYGSECVPMGSLWVSMGLSVFLWGFYGPECVPMGLNVSLWGPYGSLWV